MNISRALIALAFISGTVCAETTLRYLGNEGVAVFQDGHTILFDPLFREDYSQYTLVPESERDAMFSGAEPYQDISAVFVSHHHQDHFDPADMIRLLAAHDEARLYAPQQAIDAMKRLAEKSDTTVFDRITSIELGYDDSPQTYRFDDVSIQAFPIPHSGWPKYVTDVQNLGYQVTIDDEITVVHLGDADPNRVHFERHENEWHRHDANVAMPPYWFFVAEDGNDILKDIIQADHSVGIHVPDAYGDPKRIPKEFRAFDLFVEPGETRTLGSEADENPE